jgi:hypothetical protein
MNHARAGLATLALSLASLPALADTNPPGVTTTPNTGTGAYSSATIGASSGALIAAGTAHIFLDIINDSATASMACSFGGTAIINGAGSITLGPLGHRSWEGSFVPSDAVNCIASAGSTPATVGVK